jgi:hypothetical protein
MRILFVLFCLGALFAGCGSANRQKELQDKEIALQQKEQELATREQELAIREELLLQKELQMDSTYMGDSTHTTDSTQVINMNVAGRWNVQMTCTETTCPGSAVGDVKTEQWEIVQQANTIIARARANDQLVRVYTGTIENGSISLTADPTGTADGGNVKITVQFKPVSNKRMEGKREITRENDCRIVYTLLMDALTK